MTISGVRVNQSRTRLIRPQSVEIVYFYELRLQRLKYKRLVNYGKVPTLLVLFTPSLLFINVT